MNTKDIYQEIATDWERDFVCKFCGSDLKVNVISNGMDHLNARCRNLECGYSEEKYGKLNLYEATHHILDPIAITKRRQNEKRCVAGGGC